MHKNIVKTKKTKIKEPFVNGKLEITRSGMGFVVSKDREQDVMVKPQDFNRAMDGDTVRVKIKHSKGKRSEGIIEEVIERGQSLFIGNVEVTDNFAFFNAASQKAMPDFYISLKNLNGARNKDRVVVKLLNWDHSGKKPEGEVVQILTGKNAGDLAMKEIIIQNGFPLNFPKNVIEEANQLNGAITPKELKKRRDYRDILTLTIDPADAKDFDDALSINILENGDYEIGVHIADVSHFVTPDSEIDKVGYARATSVYLPDRVNPMLPEKISNDLCSLRPHEDKFSFSVIFLLDKKAKIKDYWLGKTFIHSDHRFSYDEVQDIIDTGKGDFNNEITIFNSLARILRKERFANGAINFSSTEVRFLLDESGKPLELIVKESKESHQLIEEFMLLANRTVASHVSKLKIKDKPIPFPYRIHDVPNEEKLVPFVAFAKKFGYKFDTKDEIAIAKSFNQLMIDVHGKPEQHVLEQLGIRTMSKAIYTTENIGHYGLGFENYCHFTSPIRRYPDIMVHRILHQILENNLQVDKKMDEKCKHSSERERAAMEAERAGNKYKQVEFMLDKVGEDMEGVISGVSSFGFWVETVNEKCEGLVSIKDLSEFDEFHHDETEYALVGSRTGRKFRMGDKVQVKLVSANLEKRQLDFDWIPEETPGTGKGRKAKKA